MPKPPSDKSSVFLVEDPFQIPVHQPLEEHEELDEGLDLEAEPLESEDPAKLAAEFPELDAAEITRLEEALAPEHALQASHAQALSEAQADSLAQELAHQIIEDAVLEVQAQQEAAAQDEESDGEVSDVPAIATQDLDDAELESLCEAFFFLADRPIGLKRIREMMGELTPSEESRLTSAIERLQERYQASHHGFELVAVAGGYQFRSKVKHADLLKRMSKVQTQRLSSGAMETLAIVSYKQPVLKEEIDRVRGVDSSHFIRTLMDRKLIEISGRSELPGRPILYSTSEEFLSVFGLENLQALPPLQELEDMIPASAQGLKEDEDPRVKEIRRLVSQMKADRSGALNYDPREDEKLLKDIRERVSSIVITTPSLMPPPEGAQDNAQTMQG